MCGITGYYTEGKNVKEAKSHLSDLLTASASRGVDAAGIGYIEGGQLEVIKQAVSAGEFVASREYKRFTKEKNPQILIGHTRQSTKGKEQENKNNHPIFTKSGLAVVHNGILTNDEDIFREYKLDRDAEVDSEVIVKLVDYFYRKQKTPNIIKAIQKATKAIRGGLAFAIIDQSQPNLYLVASDNPLHLAYHIPTGIIYFASTEYILKAALLGERTYYNFFTQKTGRKDYIFEELENDTGVEISAKKIKIFEIERPSLYTYPSRGGVGSWRKDYEETGRGIWRLKKRKAKGHITEASDIIPIQKPSKYTNSALITRANAIYQRLVGYYFESEAEENKLEQEYRRILDTLKTRKFPIPYYLENAKHLSNSQLTLTSKEVKK